MSKSYNIAVAGVTGAVGEVMLSTLAERRFPVDNLYALASQRSVGKRVEFNGNNIPVQALEEFDFSGVDIGLFSAGASVSAVHAPRAVEAGAVVIDNTSEYRYQDSIPLIVPEVNRDAIEMYTNSGIIANPNCSTIQMVVALKPIYDAVGIERINVCTYQAVSGTGKKGMEELASQSVAILNGKPIESAEVYPKQIAFNALPQIDIFLENGYTREEMKMVWETRKIFADESIQVNPTTVRIPVFFGHSEAIHIETRDKINAEQAREILREAPGIIVLDERENGGYPTAVTESSGKDGVFVGRIRDDISHPKGLNLWVVSDNVRKGAALNSIQIAEALVKKYI